MDNVSVIFLHLINIFFKSFSVEKIGCETGQFTFSSHLMKVYLANCDQLHDIFCEKNKQSNNKTKQNIFSIGTSFPTNESLFTNFMYSFEKPSDIINLILN